MTNSQLLDVNLKLTEPNEVVTQCQSVDVTLCADLYRGKNVTFAEGQVCSPVAILYREDIVLAMSNISNHQFVSIYYICLHILISNQIQSIRTFTTNDVALKISIVFNSSWLRGMEAVRMRGTYQVKLDYGPPTNAKTDLPFAIRLGGSGSSADGSTIQWVPSADGRNITYLASRQKTSSATHALVLIELIAFSQLFLARFFA